MDRFGVFGELERRSFTHTVGEMRNSGTPETGTNDGTFQVIGHAAVFGKPSVEMMSPLGVFTEYINARAFDPVLARLPDVLLTIDHDPGKTLARTTAKTLDLSIDGEGLRYWARCTPTTYANDLRLNMQAGNVTQASFLFRIAPGGEEWEIIEDEEGRERVVRTIYEVGELFDVCITASGAYPDTDSGLMRTLAFDYAFERGLIEARKAIPFKETPKADIGETWDAGAQTKGASTDDLMAMCAWYDPTKKDADGNLLASAFKLPHHTRDGHKVVYKGVTAAMSRLNQSGTQIPDGDRKAVHTHLAKHYKQFDKEAPELRTIADIQAESRRVTDELRALGDVVWGPEEGTNDVYCDLECALNDDGIDYGPGYCYFSVVDVAVTMDKAIVCEWPDYRYWLVPFTMIDKDPQPAEMDQWVEIDTAWVTTAEGYEAKMRSATDRREARMADTETPAAAPTEESATEAASVEETEEVRDAAKTRLLAEARARINRFKLTQ